MNKLLYAVSLLFGCVACSPQYTIDGISNVSVLDGKKLYIKTVKDSQLSDLDSCDVVHGKFHMQGAVDSAQIVMLYMDENNQMPMVLEEANLNVEISPTKRKVTGSPLNEKLFAFLDKKAQLDNEIAELSHRESQMIMNGYDQETIQRQLSSEAERLLKDEDELLTNFITENFDNILSVGLFQFVTSTYDYPVMTPWIESIMLKATPYFKENPYVKAYLADAETNMKRLQVAP